MSSVAGNSEVNSVNPHSTSRKACRYFLRNACRFGESCRFSHDMPQLRSNNNRRPQQQIQLLTAEEKHGWEISKDKSCGICLEVIMEKSPRQRRFGILPNCCHIFCVDCILKWRKFKQNDMPNKNRKTCPECRIASDYVCYSKYWVDTKESKDKLLTDYRKSLSDIPCYHFETMRRCRFGNECFYKHALPNGELVDLGKPKPRRQSTRTFHMDGNPFHLEDFLIDVITDYYTYMENESDFSGDSDLEEEVVDNYFDFDYSPFF